jgi:hypothetical protein
VAGWWLSLSYRRILSPTVGESNVRRQCQKFIFIWFGKNPEHFISRR